MENYSLQFSEIKLSYKPKIKPSERPQINNSTSAYQILKKHWDDDKIEFLEEFKVIYLNQGSKVLGIADIAMGGISSVPVDLRVIFNVALKANATMIIMAHNHPSGNLIPSTADIHLTEKVANAGKLLDIEVTDHIIITSEGYLSLLDEGYI